MFGNAVFLLASSLGAVWLLYAVVRLVRVRRSFKDLPKPPHSFFWGHLKLLGEISSLFPPQTHPQYYYSEIAKRYSMPGVWYLDLWPIVPPQLIVTSAELSREILTGQPYPIHDKVEEFMSTVIGPNTIVATNGNLWRALHHIMAPSFTPMAVKSQVTTIIYNSLMLRDRLLARADEGIAFSLEEEVSKTVFDVTSTIVLGFSLNAQKGDGRGLPLLSDFRQTFELAAKYVDAMNPIKKFKLWWTIRAATQRSSKRIRTELKERHRILREQKVLPSGKAVRSILDRLVIQRLEEPGRRDEQVLDQKFVDLMVSNLKALMGGGQGTTADTLCLTYMCLSLYPDVVRRMREEHDRVFDPDLTTTVDILTESPSKTNELEYTSAVIKETLRLFPVGFGLREAPEGVTTLDYKGACYPVSNFMIVLLNHAVQLDPAHWPNPTEYVPDRFLESYEPKHDRYAWRPFSRGPRACAGQELAMDELRIMLLLTARWLDFETVLGKVPTESKITVTDWETRVGDLAFQQLKMSAAPRSEMRMRVRKSGRS